MDKRKLLLGNLRKGGGEGYTAGVYLSFLRSSAGTGLTEILGRVVMEL